MSDRPTLLLVHGAWHGAWAWNALRDVLHERGWRTEAIDLPTVHAGDARELGLADDSAAVARAAADIDGPVAVVAHSYGGAPVSEGAAGVAHIVFVAAFALDAGESLLGAVGGEAPSWWTIDGDFVTPGNADQPARELFFADVDEAVAVDSVSRLRRQPFAAFDTELTRAAWHDTPSSYVVTRQDAVFPVEAQEALAARSGSRTFHMSTSHSPFLSRPDELADILETVLS